MHLSPLGHNPMTYRDAAIVAAIAALAIWILGFFANSTYSVMMADIAEFAFNAVKSYVISWAGIFVTLSGLKALIKEEI